MIIIQTLVKILEYPPVKVSFTIAYGIFLYYGIISNHNKAVFYKLKIDQIQKNEIK